MRPVLLPGLYIGLVGLVQSLNSKPALKLPPNAFEVISNAEWQTQ
jgi:hypothetical protein